MPAHIFGIRHHGPGCARSLVAALPKLQPDCVLVEGPPEADELFPFFDDETLVPPVAILLYREDDPKQSVFYPFAEFSPEWQAIRYARQRSVPVRFFDLPQRHRFALLAQWQAELNAAMEACVNQNEAVEEKEEEEKEEVTQETTTDADSEQAPSNQMYDDPLAVLASAAGYNDPKLWWEHVIEQRIDSTNQFEAILEAMTSVREHWESSLANDTPAAISESQQERRKLEPLREAWMRQSIREAEKEGFQRIAVVCGAWHAPALIDFPKAKADADMLKGLPKTKVTCTLVPWTFSRLSFRSGYGAGVYSPEWYDCLWRSPADAPTHWLTRAGRLLRKQDLPASSASVIEAVRLSEALAAMRGLPLPGIREVSDSALTVLCFGNHQPLELVRQELEIGHRMGSVPSNVPTLPLARDIEAQQKKLRLPPSTEIKQLDLDLRKENDLARSHLLHRLGLLGILWGLPRTEHSKQGSFHEFWTLQWQVEFVVTIIERSALGSTVIDATTAYVEQEVKSAADLAALTQMLQKTLLADLPEATALVLDEVSQRSVTNTNVREMGMSLPALARSMRYTDVRGTRIEAISPVYRGLFERVLIGLPIACSHLDEDAARGMLECIDAIEESTQLLEHQDDLAEWNAVLHKLARNGSVHALLRGKACRLQLDHGLMTEPVLFQQARLELSPINQPLDASQWLEGILAGSALSIVHQDGLWISLDCWIDSLVDEVFQELLPLVRRSFSNFQAPERRAIAETVSRLNKNRNKTAEGLDPLKAGDVNSQTLDIDLRRARLTVPVLNEILGIDLEPIFGLEQTAEKENVALAASENPEDVPTANPPTAQSPTGEASAANSHQRDLLPPARLSTQVRLTRWRLILGEPASPSCGGLTGPLAEIDAALCGLYGGGADDGSQRKAGLGSSSPKVNRWLGDIRKYFPKSVVQVMQRDAVKRLGMRNLLLEPELLESLEADVHLVATLVSLSQVMPAKTKETARIVVNRVVQQVMDRLRDRTIQSIKGSLNRASRTSRPKANEFDWHRTIRKNLDNYLPDRKTIIAERLVGYRRKTHALREIHLCVDQSGSMATSVVYSSIFAAVLASIKSIRTRMVVFDTSIVDLTDLLADPVDVIFGTQLGGGTDINRAVACCSQYITKPSETIFVMITDLYEGGDNDEMLARVQQLVSSGVQVLCLLALSDEGSPIYDANNAAEFAAMWIPTFGCTPDLFPDLLVAAIQKKDISMWVSENVVS